MIRRNLGLTREQLDAVFTHWVKALHLDNWHITCDLYSAVPDLPDAERTQGEATPDFRNFTASIKVLPLELWVYPETPHDMEQVVVHELLHCKLDILWNDCRTNSLQQQLLHAHIDEQAWLLVDLRRGGPLLAGDHDPAYLAPPVKKPARKRSK
jgi:hypothetical protein